MSTLPSGRLPIADDRTTVTLDSLPRPQSAFPHGLKNGNVLQVSGQAALDPESGQVTHPGDVAKQTITTLEYVAAVVKQGGLALGDILMIRVYLEDRAYYEDMNTAYERFIDDRWDGQPAPARTTIIVGLPIEGLLVEIDALAFGREPEHVSIA